MKPVYGMLGIVATAVVLTGCAAQQSTTTTKPVKGKEVAVGLLLPLSGQYATYGKYSQNGAECAAGAKEPCAAVGNIRLVPKDSGASVEKAVAAARELVEQDHVAAIVGPLMSEHAVPVAKEAERLQVPLVSLSQRDGVAEIGDNTFRIAMSPQSQVNSLANFAVKDRGLHRFAVLYPNNKLGEQYRDLFRDAVTRAGGEIAVDRSYPAALPAQLSAYLQPKKVEQTEIEVVGGADETVAPATLPAFAGVKGVDAVFIPDSYQAVVGMLKAYGAKAFGGATLLGTNRWNSPGILDAGKAANGLIFVDGFFKQSGDERISKFVSDFSQAYGVDPTILEAQAYDAVAMVASAAGRSGDTPAAVRSGLKKIRQFHGVSGKARLTNDGDAEKELFILTVDDGVIQEAGRKVGASALLQRTGDPAPLVADAPRVKSPKYDIAGEAVPVANSPADLAVSQLKYGQR